jgi:hypothetical protein
VSDEPRYTLNEAKLELNRQECARHGHDYNIIANPVGSWRRDGHEPTEVVCDRCKKRWTVTEASK